MSIFSDKKEKRRLDNMNSQQKADMIKRLENERRKINSEIESLLRTYSKESGNRALRRKNASKGIAVNDWLYIYEDQK